MKTIQAPMFAYLSSGAYSQNQFASALREGDEKRMIDALILSANGDLGGSNLTQVGQATVSLDILDEDAIRLGIVETLKEKRADVLASAHAEAKAIDEQIQNLLAITYEVSA